MIAILTFAVIGFLVLTVIYLLVSVYSRSVRREKLEKEFDGGDFAGDRDAFVEKGLQAYQHSLRRWLILLVYVIPAAAVAVTIYLVNYS
ncbi:MAG: hypothetical protein INF93_09960 [Rhodobacter sp.]|nr:hypothetical protein [Rhodobacter sp.]